MQRITSTVGGVLLMGLVLSLAPGASTSAALASASHSAATPCASAAQAMLKSCQAGATDDYWLAAALCANLTSRRGMSDCMMQAFADKKDAQDTCTEQYQARREVCDDLGGGAYQPDLDPANFVAGVTNPFFPLVPGTTFIYEQQTADGIEHIEVHVTHEIKEILDIPCIVVTDTVTLNGKVKEDTFDWYAQDVHGNVWYMGEESRGYEDGELVSLDGSWKSGRDGALPGIIMEAHPRVDDIYRQEYLPGEAEDIASIASLDRSVTVPYGSFNHCLMTEDFSPLDPAGAENKFYAEGVGNVLEIDADGSRVELISVTHD